MGSEICICLSVDYAKNFTAVMKQVIIYTYSMKYSGT